jgi:hypothetical protein
MPGGTTAAADFPASLLCRAWASPIGHVVRMAAVPPVAAHYRPLPVGARAAAYPGTWPGLELRPPCAFARPTPQLAVTPALVTAGLAIARRYAGLTPPGVRRVGLAAGNAVAVVSSTAAADRCDQRQRLGLKIRSWLHFVFTHSNAGTAS